MIIFFKNYVTYQKWTHIVLQYYVLPPHKIRRKILTTGLNCCWNPWKGACGYCGWLCTKLIMGVACGCIKGAGATPGCKNVGAGGNGLANCGGPCNIGGFPTGTWGCKAGRLDGGGGICGTAFGGITACWGVGCCCCVWADGLYSVRKIFLGIF